MYSFKSRVRYSEVDKDGYLSLEAIMNYFQDCSSFHSEDLGVGLGFLQERKLGWMIIAWHVRILKRAKMGEEITIGTWPYSFKHIKGGRNYVLKNADGETIAMADSEWVLYDLDKERITKISPEISEKYTIEEPLDMGSFRKGMNREEDTELRDEIVVTPFFLDTNGHVNNVKYLSLAEGYLGGPSMYDELFVEYRNQAFLHDKISVFMEKDLSKKRIILKNQKDDLLVGIEFEKSE